MRVFLLTTAEESAIKKMSAIELAESGDKMKSSQKKQEQINVGDRVLADCRPGTVVAIVDYDIVVKHDGKQKASVWPSCDVQKITN